MTKTLIIAEAGSNHNGDIDTAYKLIDAAVEAGADVVKFQNYEADKLFSTKSKRVNNHDVFKLFKPLEMPKSWQRKLFDYCEEKNIEFMSTPFHDQAVDELYELGVKRFKVSGFESTDLRHIKYVASTKLPIIISAGIGCSIEFVEEIINTCNEVGCNDVTILHCNNAYPTPQSEINLGTMVKIKNHYGDRIKVGLSDHTESTITPALATALGAQCIEKHYTLSKQLSGPDHFFAMEPDQLKEMVENIRISEISLGVKVGSTKSELLNIQGKRSVVIKRDVKKGEILSPSLVTTKRPHYGDSIPAQEYFNLFEKKYKFVVDLEEDDFLKWEHIKND